MLFGFHGINLLNNLVSREWLRILENFHFSISISKHFDFTFHFSKKSESILISLSTSRKRVKAFYFHFSLLELQKPTLAGPCSRPPSLNGKGHEQFSLFLASLFLFLTRCDSVTLHSNKGSLSLSESYYCGQVKQFFFLSVALTPWPNGKFPNQSIQAKSGCDC